MDWDREPLVPLTVNVYVPATALPEAVTVMVDEPVVVRLVGLNETVTFAGLFATLRATLELKPPAIVIVAVLETLAPPRVAVREFVEVLSEKFLTTKLKLVVRLRPALVPVTTIGYVPPVVVLETTSVRVVVPNELSEGAVKLAETPAGIPATPRVTGSEKPLEAASVIVLVPLLPATTVTFPELDNAKPGAMVAAMVLF